jgi:hypothetical protein
MIAGAIGFFVLRFAMKGPEDVVKTEIKDIKDGKIDAAYDLLTDDFKSRMPRDQFETFLNEHPGLKAEKSIDVNQNQIFNDTASVSGQVTSDTGGKEEFKAELRKDGSTWKITLFEVWERTSRAPASTKPVA